MYVRNLGEQIDLPWQNVFQTENKEEVEQYCRNTGTEFEWLPDNRLRTSRSETLSPKHPKSGEMVWFNQAHLFTIRVCRKKSPTICSIRSGKKICREMPITEMARRSKQRVLNEIRAVFDEAKVVFPWEKNDVMLLDNMLVAHGRTPLKGKEDFGLMAEVFSPYGV